MPQQQQQHSAGAVNDAIVGEQHASHAPASNVHSHACRLITNILDAFTDG